MLCILSGVFVKIHKSWWTYAANMIQPGVAYWMSSLSNLTRRHVSHNVRALEQVSRIMSGVVIRSTIVLIVTALLGGLIVWRALDLDLVADRGSDRIFLMALPVCISDLYHHKDADYTAHAEVRNQASHYRYTVFKEPYRAASPAIAAMMSVPITQPEQISFWGYDDRGLADFCKIAFTLFGPDLAAFSKFWLTILMLSAALFLLGLGKHPVAPVVLWFSLLSVYLSLALYSFMETPVALHEERAFEFLSYLSALHIALFPHLVARVDRRTMVGLLGQVAVFTFLYHCRSSIGWQLLPIAASALLALVLRFGSLRASWRRGRQGMAPALLSFLPVIITVIGLIALSGYRHATYHQAYFDEQGGRNFYHNALMGLHGMVIDGEPSLEISDGLVKEAVKSFAARHDDSQTNDFMYDVPYGRTYENDAKNYYFFLIGKNYRNTLKYYLNYKISNSAQRLFGYSILHNNVSGKVKIYGDTYDANELNELYYKKAKSFLFTPLNNISLFVILIGIIYAAGFRPPILVIIFVTLFFLAASFIPSVLFYSQGMRQHMGMALSVALLAHLLLFALITTAFSLIGKANLASKINN